MTDFRVMRAHANHVCDVVETKDKDYGSSWKKRGGAGAFMMAARKWDRIENLAGKEAYNIFRSLETNKGDIADDIDDLIGYLLLIRETSLGQAHYPRDYPRDHAALLKLIVEGSDGTEEYPFRKYEEGAPQWSQDGRFQCEGGYGNGMNVYRCLSCRTFVYARGLEDAHACHPAVACPVHP